MRGSANLQISTHQPQSEIQTALSLWTGPSSPPFLHPTRPIFNDASSLASSPSTPSESEFEFDSVASFEIRDELPLSPKLIAADFWTPAASSSSYEAPRSPVITKHTIAPLSHMSTSTSKQPPSTSVKQLMTKEMQSMIIEHEEDDDIPLDFYSAPQTPMWTPPRDKYTDSKQRPFSLDERSLLNTLSHDGKRGRKSKSSLLVRRTSDKLAPLEEEHRLQSSKSESNTHFSLWASSMAWDHQKGEEEKGGVKKQGSKSCVRWAFKDLLRRTVPSSKAEASYITKVMGSGSSKHSISSVSPLASPTHSSASASTSRAARPPLSPTPNGGRHLTQGRPSTTPRSPQRHPSTPGRTPNHPAPSPPRSPLSPHAAHYQQNRAQSLELTRKTFLPYRQSLLGCLGGSAAFSPEQKVW